MLLMLTCVRVALALKLTHDNERISLVSKGVNTEPNYLKNAVNYGSILSNHSPKIGQQARIVGARQLGGVSNSLGETRDVDKYLAKGET